MRTTSREARAGFAPESVDLLFIDASHRREDVTADLLGWMPLLAAGATVALHDVTTKPGVHRVARDVVLRPGSGLTEPRLVDALLVVTWTGAGPSRVDAARMRATLDVERIRHRMRHEWRTG